MKASARIGVSTMFVVLMLLASGAPRAQDAGSGGRPAELTRHFLSGIGSYRQGDYAGAVDHFGKIVSEGVVNAKLYYNLANAYLKSGDLGRAVLWYERALALNPGDPDLRFNYEVALSLRKDEEGEKTAIRRILFFWKYRMSRGAVLWAAVALNALFWMVLTFRLLRKKRPLNAFSGLVLAAALVFVATAGFNYYEEKHLRSAVVLAESLSVRSGFSPDATELFVLHAGTRVRVESEKDRFVRIYFAPGKIGWVRKEDVGVI